MDLLERTWESFGQFFGGLLSGFERGVTAMFGTSNARLIRKMYARVESINELESRFQAMSDADLKEQTAKFRQRLKAGESLDDILVEAFAVCREGGRRFLGMRHYDVQMVGGMVLHGGAIAEMVTGEGKTLVATLPAYLNAIEGKGVHVVTVNDYLARRDMEWMAPLYMGLGLTVGAIQSDMEVDERQAAYDCDITYGTNNEFGFDYLRDNMRPAARGDDRFPKPLQQSQKVLNFAIIDEVDNILVDEARTPLIISGPAFQNVNKYGEADRVARALKRETHFVVNEKDHNVSLTDDGVREAERLAGVESFYTADNMEWPHLIDNALKAHYLYQLDVRYVVKEGKVIIVDEFTGRLMDGRQWSDGLHQAVEAKEGVKIKEETQTLATITLQNFFKLYNKLCGMTGTAMTEASEFWKIYKLDVIAIPTNRGMQRIEFPDAIYRTEKEKFIAVADDIERVHKYDTVVLKTGEELVGLILKETEDKIEYQPKETRDVEVVERSKIDHLEYRGRPVLIGTVSIEKSERIGAMLEKRGVKHLVLNAKHHKREADIVAQAGRLGAVTIATNMAGRGTDIILGGNAETMAWAKLQEKYKTRLDVPAAEWDGLVREIEEKEQMKPEGVKVKELGGLYVIGTERHEARRIDLQLRGRCGRQGDPGSSRFFLSLEDDLMRIFAGQWVKSVLDWLGMKEGERIEHPMVSRRISAVQKKMEERNFEIRKNLLEYDEVMDEQRKRVYRFRQNILDGENCRDVILTMVRKQVNQNVESFLKRDYGAGVFAAFAATRLAATFEARDFVGMDYAGAEEYALSEATRSAETHVQDGLDENLPEGSDEEEWNWEAMAKMANTRWGTNLRDKDLKKIGRDHVAEHIIELARERIKTVELSEGKPFLEDDFGYRTVVAWARAKFGLDLDLDAIKKLDVNALKKYVVDQAVAAYDRKEAEYPIVAGIYNCGGGEKGQLNREELVAWARERFNSSLEVDDLKNKTQAEMVQLMLPQSQRSQQQAEQTIAEVKKRVAEVFQNKNGDDSDAAFKPLATWSQETLKSEMTAEKMADLDAAELEHQLLIDVEDRYRPEIRRMERSVLLQVVDSMWKDHLLMMDRLRSSVGLVGYAQIDPKVEYKREGMKTFEQMWHSLDDRVTELVFKVEQLNEDFVRSTFPQDKMNARHDSMSGADDELDASQEQTSSSSNSGTDTRPEPIRNRGQRVGRNDPCPCGSGKKYKNCHMRSSGGAIV
ncbi:preprotein translocase subunit SecA [Anatilimnocola sp. NA78]|uniref:preprotein translocase subunit SecA n=1 Tax=Anatilimnocola sp. NA78 TaxID=3415683 RepID=UPI003CE5C904